MKKTLLLACMAAAFTPLAAHAQDSTATTATPPPPPPPSDDGPKAPDGSKAFGIEPYIGILGGYESFDKNSQFGTVPGRGRFDGALISGIAGINVPLGPGFVGVEGNGTKGFGDVDWEYGVKGRVGARAGDSGMVFVSAGYQWIDGRRGFGDHNDWIYGLGVEAGPKDIGLGGITGNAGIRIRLEVQTFDFNSIRPMGGVIFHF